MTCFYMADLTSRSDTMPSVLYQANTQIRKHVFCECLAFHWFGHGVYRKRFFLYLVVIETIIPQGEFPML